MNKKIITRIVFVLLGTAGISWAGCSVKAVCVEPKDKRDNPVDVVLTQLSRKTRLLKSYQAQVEYKFIQPDFDTTTLKKGALYYAKSDTKSNLRADFKTLKQDDEKEQKYREEEIFDGVWLTHINFQIKQVMVHQLTEPNKPMDAFVLASRNLPIVGFARIEDLKKQFDIKLIVQKPSERDDFIQLHLKVKPDSTYKDKYTSIDFWIDKKLYLPAKIVAVSTEEDIYEIKMLKPKVNKKLDKRIFDFKTPRGFGREIIPLKKKAK
jgi:outer membrane lipoprotein-sorting protein